MGAWVFGWGLEVQGLEESHYKPSTTMEGRFQALVQIEHPSTGMPVGCVTTHSASGQRGISTQEHPSVNPLPLSWLWVNCLALILVSCSQKAETIYHRFEQTTVQFYPQDYLDVEGPWAYVCWKQLLIICEVIFRTINCTNFVNWTKQTGSTCVTYSKAKHWYQAVWKKVATYCRAWGRKKVG